MRVVTDELQCDNDVNRILKLRGGGSMWIKVAAAALFATFLGAHGTTAQETINFLDAHNILRKAAGIPTGTIQERECSNKNGCTKYCAKKPQCKITRELRNIRIVSIDSLEYIIPDVNQIPFNSVEQNLTFNNCLSSEWPWEETLKHTLTRTVTSQIKTGFKGVKNRKQTLNLDAKLFDSIGIKVGDEISSTTTVETSTTNTVEQKENIYIEKPLAVTVPASTQVTITYSDLQKRVRIPVKMKALLEADIYFVETISTVFGKYPPPGTVWYERAEGLLSTKAGAGQRTINAEAVINALGGKRDLTISLSEKGLACDESADAQRSEEFISMASSVARSCTADVDLSQAAQSGEDLSAVFDVEVTDGCKKHNGEIEYTAVIEKLDEFGDGLGEFETRDGYAYWSNEEEEDFALSHDESGFFYEDEALVELTDIDLNECTCIIGADE